jgi:spermidine/putrescine transport system substrate-binding protein
MTGGAITRRELLRRGTAGLAGAALLGAAGGCAFIHPDVRPASVDKPLVPRIDGDLVYFNWADYVDPSVFRGFEKEYGVRIVQSNFDSMESMQAKLSAGNRYDVIFPSAQWVQKLVAAGQLRTIDRSAVPNAARIFDHYPYFADPWYDRHSAHSIPFTMYKTGIAWRKDKLGARLGGSWNDLWNQTAKGRTFLLADRDEVLGMGALLLGLPLNTANPTDLDRIVHKIATLRPYLRAFSSDDYDDLLNGDAWLHQMWSGDMAALLNQAKDPSLYGFEAPREGTPVNSDTYAIPANAEHPGTAALFIDYMLRPENVRKNIEYIGYPMPVHGTEETYAKLVARFPECRVTLTDLSRHLYFSNDSVAATQARDAAFTEIQAG